MIRKYTLDISHSIFMMKYRIFFIALCFFFSFSSTHSLHCFHCETFAFYCFVVFLSSSSFESSSIFVAILIISANISFYLLPFYRPLSLSLSLSMPYLFFFYLLVTLPFTFQFPINVDFFSRSFVRLFSFPLIEMSIHAIT